MMSSSKHLIHLLIYITLFLVPVWYRLPDAPRPFTTNYVTGGLTFIPVALTIALWLILGRPGLRELLRDRLRVSWLLLILLFVLWAFVSWHWAYIREVRPDRAVGVINGSAVKLAVIALFIFVVTCTTPPPQMIGGVLVAGMLLYGMIGGLQVANQSEIGLLCEQFSLNPQQRGVSVIQSGDIRWLRAYGCASHPNIFAGYLVVSLLASGAWIVSKSNVFRWLGTLCFSFGLWVLFLTFSRGAWIGFIAGAFALLPLLIRGRLRLPAARQQAAITLFISALLGTAFILLYQPLLLARAGVGLEDTELRSVNERVVYINVAQVAMARYPVLGVGAGNFDWFASYYLFYETDLDMRGDYVHHAMLVISTELGTVGALLFILIFVIGIETALRRMDYTRDDSGHRAVLLAGVIALGVIGLVEHYPVTMFQFHILWLTLLAVSITPYSGANSSEAMTSRT